MRFRAVGEADSAYSGSGCSASQQIQQYFYSVRTTEPGPVRGAISRIFDTFTDPFSHELIYHRLSHGKA